jgi:hypothetical protein
VSKLPGLSATNIVRLKAVWEADYKAWSQRDLSQKRYVYWWADGVYFNVRLDEERSCVLVLIGAGFGLAGPAPEALGLKPKKEARPGVPVELDCSML